MVTLSEDLLNLSIEHTIPISLPNPIITDFQSGILVCYSSRVVHVIMLKNIPVKVSLQTHFDIMDLSVDPNESRSYLLCACSDRLLRLLDVAQQQYQGSTTGSAACHVLYAFNLGTLGKTVHVRWCLGDPEQFVACSDDKCVRVWSLRDCIKHGS